MIFLSAQPDDYYFLWQLQLQLLNFNSLGLPAAMVHVLIAYDPEKGLNEEFETFISNNDHASFYIYPDKRQSSLYASSVRPHLIRQHLEKYPQLCNETIFYHDSDILLRECPNFSLMQEANTWYVSDTRSYLGSRYISHFAEPGLLQKMCHITGCDPMLVLANDHNAGGAQYVFRNTTISFWEKAERDCERLYDMLCQYLHQKAEIFHLESGKPASQYKGIQAWCTDMWVLFHHALQNGFNIKIHKELDFCWPHQELSKWEHCKILHYSGVPENVKNKNFCKDQFIHHSPFYADLSQISSNHCSAVVASWIHRYLEQQRKKRTDLRDVTFLIPLRIDSEDRLENIRMILRFLHRHFDTHIIITEADKTAILGEKSLPHNCKYRFIHDEKEQFHRTKYNNIMVRQAKTPFIVLYDADLVLPPEHYVSAARLLREGRAHLVVPYHELYSADYLFKEMFKKMLDITLFEKHKGKFTIATKRAVGGAVFLNKAAFENAGMENEHIASWGPEDKERMKRMEILGYRTVKADGPAFHLPHKRNINSKYEDHQKHIRYMNEYLKICSMKKEMLENYIGTWEWNLQNN